MSRIEQLIDEIEEYVEGCKPAPFSQSKIIVQKEQLYELLTELRLKTPDEIKRYQKIIAQKDKIISDAQAQAEQMQFIIKPHDEHQNRINYGQCTEKLPRTCDAKEIIDILT